MVLTRETDTEVNPSNEDVNGDGTVAPEGGPARTEQIDDLQARVNICNLAAADLLVSVHYNGAENTFLSGYEVWFNDQREFSGRSEAFATLMHEALEKGFANAGYDAVDRGIGIEDHAVTGPHAPVSWYRARCLEWSSRVCFSPTTMTRHLFSRTSRTRR